MSVRKSSIDAYIELKNDGTINQQEFDILYYLTQQSSPVSRRQVSNGTGIETSSVAGRVNRLIEADLIDELERSPCPVSGKNVHKLQLARLENTHGTF